MINDKFLLSLSGLLRCVTEDMQQHKVDLNGPGWKNLCDRVTDLHHLTCLYNEVAASQKEIEVGDNVIELPDPDVYDF